MISEFIESNLITPEFELSLRDEHLWSYNLKSSKIFGTNRMVLFNEYDQPVNIEFDYSKIFGSSEELKFYVPTLESNFSKVFLMDRQSFHAALSHLMFYASQEVSNGCLDHKIELYDKFIDGCEIYNIEWEGKYSDFPVL